MTIETSTANILLTLTVTLQAWMIHKLFRLQTKLSILLAQCPLCRYNREHDTDRITKQEA